MRYTKLYALYTVLIFFASGRSIDDLLVRVSLVAQIIKDANLICILFSVKHLQTFWESWMSLSNVYTYPFNQQLVMKTYVESHDKKPKDQKNFYMWTIMGVFIQNINFLIFSRLCMLVPITMLHFLNALTCSLITLFFQVHPIASDIVLFSTISNKSCTFAGN